MAIHDYDHSVAERFMRYVRIDTQSDENSPAQPSTEKQKDLLRLLVAELHETGIADAEMDEHGYVYATIPSTTDKKNVPTICLCSHVDTAGDCSGTDVKPILHKNWDGSDIVLPDDPSIVISKNDYPYLEEKTGADIITASGTTLLGADNKAGVAIIMDLARYLVQNPQIKHGAVRILFTPDEEIGRGVDKVDMKKLDAQYGYTMDDGENFALEWETFSADAMTFTFHGVAAHPGAAKEKLVHATKVAAHFVASLPRDRLAPEVTEGRDGFVHPTSFEGGLEKAIVKILIRDFDTAKLVQHEKLLAELAESAVAAFPDSRMEAVVKEQYRNMGDVIRNYPEVVENAREAYARVGLTPCGNGIRGGTDGSQLSFMGMPCPNLFTGQMAIHGKREFVCVQDMEKSVEMLVALVQVWEEKTA